MSDLVKALAGAQADFPAIHKGRKATVPTKSGSYSYTYADLSDVVEAVRPVLHKHGLVFIQPLDWRDGQAVIVTRLLHESGDSLESVCPLPPYERAQEMGSAITYARRYSLTSLLGIVTEDDDDAQTVQHAKPKTAPAPAQEKTSSPAPGKGSGSGVSPVKLKAKRQHLEKLAESRGLRVEDELGGPLEEASFEAVEAAIGRLQQKEPAS